MYILIIVLNEKTRTLVIAGPPR